MQLGHLIANNRLKIPAIGLRNRCGPIGLDFGIEKINLVQVRRGSGSFSISAAASIPCPIEREQLLQDPLTLKQLFRATLKPGGFSGNEVVVALPPSLLQLSLVHYHCGHDQKHDEALGKAVSEQFGDRVNGAIIDYMPIRPKVEEQLERSALVAMAGHDHVIRFLETLRIAGLKVHSLEVGPVAIRRLLTRLDDQNATQRKIMAINFATHHSFVTVLWGGQLLLDREFELGLDSILDAVSAALDMPRDQARSLMETHGFSDSSADIEESHGGFLNDDIALTLMQIVKPVLNRFAREIKKVLIYTAAETQGGALDVIYILGSLARWPNVDTYLTNLLNLPVKTINPFFGFSVDDFPVHSDNLEPVSGIAVATGLALHGVD